MKLVKESLNELNFERIKDPLGALGIGKRQLIRDWLDKYRITNYTINKDYTIDGDMIILEDIDLKQFPDYIQFGEIVNGGFFCNDNQLITLRGCPRYVRFAFCCNNNNLVSLKGCPIYVGGDFYCDNKFTRREVRVLCDVRHKIIIKILLSVVLIFFFSCEDQSLIIKCLHTFTR